MADHGKFQRVAEVFRRYGVETIIELKDVWIEGVFVGRDDDISDLVVKEESGRWTISDDSEYVGCRIITLESEEDALAWLEKALALPPSREELLARIAALETEVEACREQIARMQRGEVQEHCAGWYEGQCALCTVDEQNYDLERRLAKCEALLKRLCGLCARACQGSEDVWLEWQS